MACSAGHVAFSDARARTPCPVGPARPPAMNWDRGRVDTVRQVDTDRQVDRWVDRESDRWTQSDRWTDVWTESQTGGQTDPAPGQVMDVGHFSVSSEGPVQAA